ncbi:MAG: hypothetical protein KBS41_04105 [Oscillospiraceae bacterium]|nr:hypothetical protein [Candidatus Equicaccousia limihippi]
MYKISLPLSVSSDKEEWQLEMQFIKKMSPDRVFIAFDTPFFDREMRENTYKVLKSQIEFFRENGVKEIGLWCWTFMHTDGHLHPEYAKMTGKDGAVGNFCPSDERFVADTADLVQNLAGLGADLLMFDDDFRYGWLPSGPGCLCDNHIKMVSDKVGESLTRQSLASKIFRGGTNKYRDAWLDALKESFINFSLKMREAADKVNPQFRIGLCSCMSVWDQDGADTYEIARALAGNTKPFCRLIGAPYWGVKQFFTCRINHVIEQERIELAWKSQENADIEVFTEGDTYPRPRFTTPSSYLEAFDTVLRADGKSDGILKYAVSYALNGSKNNEYGIGSFEETGYVENHIASRELYAKIDEYFGTKVDSGFRIYEFMHKFADSVFPQNRDVSKETVENQFYSYAAKALSDNSVPTNYTRTDCPGVAFGENARHLTPQMRKNGLLLDIVAAKILHDSGVDVGITAFNSVSTEDGEPKYEISRAGNRIYYDIYGQVSATWGNFPTYDIEISNKAKVLSHTVKLDNAINRVQQYTGTDSYYYENANGERYVVINCDMQTTDEYQYRGYCRQAL